MKKINVLHIIGGMNRCGAETFLMNVYRGINREKYVFYFLCYDNGKKFDYEDEIKELGGRIIKIPQPTKIGIVKYKKIIKKIIRENEFDIIHTHTYFNSAIPLFIAKKEGISIRIVHSHCTKSEVKSSFIKRVYNIICKRIINKNANYFIACSENAGKSLFYKNKNFLIVKNGIFLEEYLFNRENRKIIRNKLNIKNDEIVIGHIGRFEPEKNHVFLINMFERLVKNNNEYKLVLLGNGSKFDEIKSICKDKNIYNNVIFLGNVPNVNEIINCFDVFVFPSLFEGLGIAMIEAQANGLKCFASSQVPKEVDISNNVEFLELAAGAETWAGRVSKSNLKRNEFNINQCDYNIKNTVEQLEKIYNLK